MFVPGARIGPYQLERLLGKGGMGVVWSAANPETGDEVAVKLIKEDSDDAQVRRRFLREARTAMAVRHPHVVAVLDVLELDDGSPAMIMELLSGETLAERLRREHRIAFSQFADLLMPIASALGAAHALGIVHRDLKPENVYLARDAGGVETVKVLDFGIAKLTALDGDAARSTGLSTDTVMGTPAYMSPEQLFGERDIDHRSDVWAFGLVIYECLSGTLPTAGDNVGQAFKNVVAKPIRPLCELVPDLPADVSRLVDRMLSRDRERRPDHLGEVCDVLRAYTRVAVPSFGLPPALLRTAEVVAAPQRTERQEDDTPGAPPPTETLREADTLVDVRPETTAPLASDPPRRRRFVRWGVAAAVLASVAVWLATRREEPVNAPAPRPPPLQASTDVVACPIFRATGVSQPSGWLGAATAATVCERARVLLGGRPERTLVPAELLDLPRQPMDSFPVDPYDAPDARQRSLSEARGRAAAYFDGEVVKNPGDFAVTLSLLRADGTEMGHGDGRGKGLYAAVRAAMDPLVAQAALPQAASLDPVIGDWQLTRDVAAGLALLDLRLALAHNAGDLASECARFAESSRDLAELGAFERWRCAYTLGQFTKAVEVPGEEPSSTAAAATRIRIRHFVSRSGEEKGVDAIRALSKLETSPWGLSLMAATESCLLQSSDPQRAYETALVAIQAEPKNPDGQWCSPWAQLLTVTQDTSSASSAIRATEAWVPWDSNSWFTQGLTSSGPRSALGPLRRAHALSPFNAEIAEAFAGRLLAAGEREEARSVATAIRLGGYPVHRVAGDLLLMRIDASEARFTHALERAREAMEVSPGDAGWVHVQRFEVAWLALQLARIFERSAELADSLVARFVDPEPPLLDGYDVDVQARVAAVCALASPPVSSRCFSRLRALRDRLSAGATKGTVDFVRGAERYSKRDYAGAAAAWRPLMRTEGPLVRALPDAMAEVFDRTRDDDFAERLDTIAMERAGELNGATLAHARAATRAARRGDHARARTLARKVVDAWLVADGAVPAVADMRQLLARLR